MSSKYHISGLILAFALAAAPLFAADTFLITIGKDGSVRVGDKTVGLGDLGVFAATEARKDKEVNFQLSVDAGALADEVATVINICRQAGPCWEVDTWIMSCRVLGRRVEEALLQLNGFKKRLWNHQAGLYAHISGLDSLSTGVWESLICAAGGIAVAIPAHAAYNYLVSRVNKIVLDMERAAAEIVNIVSENGK